MRSGDERIAEMHKRARRMRRERDARRFRLSAAGVLAACLAVAVAVAFNAANVAPQIPAEMSRGAAASVFASGQALGYVVVALLAFALGASFTVFCIRLKKHMREKEKEDDREP